MARASELLSLARSWMGRNEADGSHKEIIDIYNAKTPLPRNYKVKYTDAWCATFISALAIKKNATNIIPMECGCGEMIKLCQVMGIWIENENRVPNPGDIIFYDWDDTGKGDNTGWSEHVGIVEKVENNVITVIEGNMNDAVRRRDIAVNGRYIRGYAVPRYEKEAEAPAEQPKEEKPSEGYTNTVTATGYAKALDSSLAGTYTATTGLNVRYDAGATKKLMVTIPKGTKVKNYGYYTSVLGTKWLYIQFVLNGVKYTGFASSKYLKK